MKEKTGMNPDCKLYGTRYCRMLNMKSCDKCPVTNNIAPEALVADLELYEQLLPSGGITRLFLERGCQFCKGKEKNKRQGYAILDMAHPEPQRIQTWLLGKKRASIGTMVPLQLGICPRCRRTLLLIEYLPMLLMLLLGTLALVLTNIRPIARFLKEIAAYMPFLVWVLAVLIGVVGGRILVACIAKKAARRMYVDVLRHPTVREMMQKGWFPIARQNRIKVMFSKSRMARGLGTAADDEQEII